MPKSPIDYSKILIYKIEHINNEELVYVGHTTNWNKRKCMHKNACKNEKYKIYNLKVYQMIRANGGWEMFQMIEVEKYPCADRREAERRENEAMKELKACMNMRNSFLTQDEKQEQAKEYNTNYYELHKEQVKEYQKNNKHKIQERMKDYRDNNKLKIQEYKKDYREANKPKIQEREKDYYEANKLKINEKVKCECGCEINKHNLKRHQKNNKHLNKMKNI